MVYTNSYTGSLKSVAACGLFWGGLVSYTNRNSTHKARRLFVPPSTTSYNTAHSTEYKKHKLDWIYGNHRPFCFDLLDFVLF